MGSYRLIKILLEQRFPYGERFEVGILIEKVEINDIYPDGIRYCFVLIDRKIKSARYLVDNYNGHGPHEHPYYFKDKKARKHLKVRDQSEAKKIFFDEVERIIKNEK